MIQAHRAVTGVRYLRRLSLLELVVLMVIQNNFQTANVNCKKMCSVLNLLQAPIFHFKIWALSHFMCFTNQKFDTYSSGWCSFQTLM